MSIQTKQDLLQGLFTASPSNFISLREQGKEKFLSQGLPNQKSEEYRFTPIAKKLEQAITRFSPASPLSLSKEQVENALIEGFEGDILVFSNGYYHPEFSSRIDGIEVSILSEKPNTPIGSIAKPEKDPFLSLNQATFSDGVFISIPSKFICKKPILLLNLHQELDGQVISPRIWIEVGDFSEVTFIEQGCSLGNSPYFVNKVIEIQGGVQSQISYHRIQHEGNQVIEVSQLETDIQRDARFTSFYLSLSGDLIRNNLSLHLKGSNSVGNMYGISLLQGKSLVDHHTCVDHKEPHAESNELYKGIFGDYSRGVFNGKILVRQDAQKTNAFQQNNNVLLSEEALINTKPQLEIWADDVKCSHGCTVGQLDEEALFYLQARGIEKTTARGLLLFAFIAEVVDKIQVESLQKYIIAQIQERLGSTF